jgi:putative tryptophan/tyrosine transport system substrate-binding protein
MNRRDTVIALLALGTMPLFAFAQQPGKVWRIGLLNVGTEAASAASLKAFRNGLRDLGYVEGQNVTIDMRWANGRRDLLPQLATELVQRKPDVIVGVSTVVIKAARQATSTVPIVMVSGSDPVQTGLVASLARPGGNITGLSNMAGETTAKLVEFAREISPGVPRVVVLLSDDRTSEAKWIDALDAAKKFMIAAVLMRATNRTEIEDAFSAMARHKPAVLIVPADGVLANHRQAIVELAAREKLPAVYARDGYVLDGGLLSYGLSIQHHYRQSVRYIDRIFKGAKPAELPIEQPTKFDLVINLKTAKVLGLTISPSLLARADSIIE